MRVLEVILPAAGCVFAAACSCGDLELGRTRDGEAEWIEVSGTLVDGAAGLCGNGILEEGESCDDGNRMDCDGCSRNCEVEDQVCGSEDTSTDGDTEEPAVPDPPQYEGDPVTVEQEPQEAIQGPGWFHIMWTGEYFSFVYKLSCPDDPGIHCLAMRRFGKDGAKIGPDWVYMPVQPGGDVLFTHAEAFDVCWDKTSSTFGLVWIQTDYGYPEDLRNSNYFQRLNQDGKPMGTPVLLWYDPIRVLWGGLELYGIRLGCSPEGYLAGYHVDVDWGEEWVTRYLYLQFLDMSGQTLDSAFYGIDGTDSNLWPESLRYLNGEFFLLHRFEPVNALVERVPADFDISWRTALLSRDEPVVFDWDVDEERGKMAFTVNTDTETFLAIVDESGEIDLETTILEDYPNVVSRITSIGGGKYAVAWQRCSCEGADPTKVEIVTESGLESEPVSVSPTSDFSYVYNHSMPIDITWTGEEIAVVIMLPDAAGTGWNQPYMQLLVP